MQAVISIPVFSASKGEAIKEVYAGLLNLKLFILCKLTPPNHHFCVKKEPVYKGCEGFCVKNENLLRDCTLKKTVKYHQMQVKLKGEWVVTSRSVLPSCYSP